MGLAVVVAAGEVEVVDGKVAVVDGKVEVVSDADVVRVEKLVSACVGT
jgi:hypothetical protein